MNRGRWKRKEKREEMLAGGLEPDWQEMEDGRERMYALLLKGVIIYLLVMGMIGAFLSAVEVDYYEILVHLVVLAAAMFCASLYYSRTWQNIAYFVLLFIIVFVGFEMRRYINSGFYAAVNQLFEKASDFFDSDAMRSYGEQVSDRPLAVTVSMSFIGTILCVWTNVLVSRKMRFGAVCAGLLCALFYPLYVEAEPSPLYITMLLTGMLAVLLLKRNGHYRQKAGMGQLRYERKGKGSRVVYTYGRRSLVEVLLTVGVLSLISVQLFEWLIPRESYQQSRMSSTLKDKTKDTMQNFALMGFMGLFNLYDTTGGMRHGILGGVNSVRFDYRTDLEVQFTPYSYDRIYLKTFVGGTYVPYANRWMPRRDELGTESGAWAEGTAKALREQYEAGEEFSAKGRMRIHNVDAAAGSYLPYYSENTGAAISTGDTQEYEFYPKFEQQGSMNVAEDDWNAYLQVPAENERAIKSLCQRAKLRGNAQQVTEQLRAYYLENIPYTLRPDMTPREKDFINYFLEENRRGYCAHFASAAVLIFRQMGIPARYVEGYAIDASDIYEYGELQEEEAAEEYYDGYLAIEDTGVVNVSVSDANAHAWVEVYDASRGWYPVELTPPSMEQEEDSIWSMFASLFGSDEEEAFGSGSSSGEGGGGFQIPESAKRITKLTMQALLGMAVLGILLLWGIRKGIWAYRYHRASLNNRLIMRYQKYIHRVSRRNEELGRQINYRQQVEWLATQKLWELDGEGKERIIHILEKAGFSNREITSEEWQYVWSLIRI